jgi:hypothetical protein
MGIKQPDDFLANRRALGLADEPEGPHPYGTGSIPRPSNRSEAWSLRAASCSNTACSRAGAWRSSRMAGSR